MTLYVAGGLHWDPLGRTRLEKWFELLKNRNIQPSHILIEYNENDLLAFKNARKYFRKICEEKLKKYGLSDADLDVLEGSFGYELDSHVGYFDNVDVLYYEKPKFCDEAITIISDQYAGMTFLENYNRNSKNFIDILSEEWWKNIQGSGSQERERYLFEQIKDKTKSFLNNDGLLIVGVNHTKDYPNKLVNLLKESEIYKNIDITNLENIL